MPTKIALIDFDETLLASSRASLEELGYEVAIATDGIAGMELLHKMSPDIVVLELVLPKLHGLQVRAAMRKHPELSKIKVIIAASPTFPVDLRKAREYGAASFLHKPYAPEDLVRAIKSLESVPVPDNDPQRVATLHSYDILDSAPEKAFDDVTQLAAIICETSGAFITFVDSDRLWFKSKVGFIANEVPRELSFCAHAIMHDEVMVVEDTSKDHRFAGNPLVCDGDGPRVRFYAGSPLRAPGGDALGSVCVIGQEPRTLRPDQKKALRLLANQVQVLLEWRLYVNNDRAARTAS
jgi:CheY-like chemotaxis protein